MSRSGMVLGGLIVSAAALAGIGAWAYTSLNVDKARHLQETVLATTTSAANEPRITRNSQADASGGPVDALLGSDMQPSGKPRTKTCLDVILSSKAAQPKLNLSPVPAIPTGSEIPSVLDTQP